MRKNRQDLQTPAEVALNNAIAEVEKLGASVLLTEAVIKLSHAKDNVSEFIDKELKEVLK